MTRLFISLGGALLGASAVYAQTGSPSMTASAGSSMVTAPPTGLNATNSTGDACAVIASLASSASAAQPSITGVLVPPESAYNCLKAIPIDKDLAVEQIEYISKYVQFQSTLAYLKDPPKEYAYPAADIVGGLKKISGKASANGYRSQYDFDVDVFNLISSARDGHFSYRPLTVGGIFEFGRPFPLVSVSEDGNSLPKVYVFRDVNASASSPTNLTWTASPVVQIDGQDIADYIENLPSGSSLQDPDAAYNQQFYELAQAGIQQTDGFSNPPLYPGKGFTLKFANGTTSSYDNLAETVIDFSRLDSGKAIFSSALLPTSTSSAATTSTSGLPIQTAAPLGYPEPVVRNEYNYANGYYLNGTEQSNDVAILSLPSFLETQNTTDLLVFQSDIEEFLKKAKAAGKSKLIVDVQANGGGTVNLGYDAFKQLFPSMTPYGTTRYRYHEAAETISDILAEAITEYNATFSKYYYNPLSYRGLLDMDYKNFSSVDQFLGPHEFHGDNFTSLVRQPIMEPDFSVVGGIQVSGYGNRSNITTQYFAAEDMVLLYDGYCGSTCAVFSEFMKTQGGVRSIVVGGRPRSGPMQAVGAVKGGQIQSFAGLNQYSLAAVAELSPEQQKKANLTLPVQPSPLNSVADGSKNSVNFADNIRQNDTNETPLQFVYEAADCRLFFTAENLFDITTLWERVSQVAWGNGTCVSGSTGDKTALPGSNFTSPKSNSTTSGGGASPSSAPQETSGAATQLVSSFMAMALAFIGATFMLL